MQEEVMKIIYTAIINKFDELLPVPPNGFKYVCFTDIGSEYNVRVLAEWRGWEIRIVPRLFINPSREATMYRVLAHQVLPEAEESIWVDANMFFQTDPNKVFQFLDHADIGFYKNPNFTNVYNEAEFEKTRYEPELIQKKMDQYRKEGFSGDGLIAGGFIVRKHTQVVETFNNLWWSEICGGSFRAQMHCNYAMWKTGLRHYEIPWLSVSGPLVAHKEVGEESLREYYRMLDFINRVERR